MTLGQNRPAWSVRTAKRTKRVTPGCVGLDRLAMVAVRTGMTIRRGVRVAVAALSLAAGCSGSDRGALGGSGGAAGSGPSGGAAGGLETGGSAGAASAGGVAGQTSPGGSGGGFGASAGGGAAGSAKGGGTAGGAGRGAGGQAGGVSAGPGGNGGRSSSGTAGAAGSVEVPAGYVPALVGVGYGGIRVVSRDGGSTWGDRAYAETAGGDDLELLRAVVYGKGLWIATGWKLVTSNDGVHWTDHGKIAAGPIPACGIVEGLAYKDGTFFAACDSSVYRSTDGLSWTKHGSIGNTGGHLFLTYRGGKFVAYGDTLTSFQSDDAATWTVMPNVQQATYCKNSFISQTDCASSSWFDGVFLRADWGGFISRSTDGQKFTRAYADDQSNTLYQSRAIAAGYVAPK